MARRVQSSFAPGLRKLRAFAATIGQADQPAIQEAAKVLVKHIKQELGAKHVSAPGQPPGKRSGRLQKSIGREVVGGVMRVGSGDFTAPILEQGSVSVDKHTGRSHTLAPRPFMRPAMEQAKTEMTTVAVGELRKRGGILNG